MINDVVLQIRLVQDAGNRLTIHKRDIRLAQISLGIVAGKLTGVLLSCGDMLLSSSVHWLPHCQVGS